MIVHSVAPWRSGGRRDGEAAHLVETQAATTLTQGVDPPSYGVSDLMLVNNIFDPKGPIAPGSTVQGQTLPPWSGCTPPATKPSPTALDPQIHQTSGVVLRAIGASAFEGISLSDLLVVTPTVPPSNRNFNAYDAQNIQSRFAFNVPDADFGLPKTFEPPGATVPGPPGVDLNPYAPNQIVPGSGIVALRGVLYVRDLLHNGEFAPGGTYSVSCNFDQSPGDFRLAPAAALSHTLPTPNSPIANANPLVDAGYNAPTILMVNGMALNSFPGSLAVGGNSGVWPHHSWRNDCEGFGQGFPTRVYNHPEYADAGFGGMIDIGADELGPLVIAGYRFGTTTFMEWNNPVNADNMYAWILGPPTFASSQPQAFAARPNSGTTNFPVRRPRYTRRGEVGVEPASGAQSVSQWRFNNVPALYYVTPFQTIAGLPLAPPTGPGVDIVPHLLPDIHPLWASYVINPGMPPLPGLLPGLNSNPFWTCNASLPNPFLYQDPTFAVINPLGTFPAQPQTGFIWLDRFSTLLGFGEVPLGPSPATGTSVPPPNVMFFGAWCQNTFEFPPASFVEYDDFTQIGPAPSMTSWDTGKAYRVTVEFKNDPGVEQTPFTMLSNIQTFMVLRQPTL